MKLLFGSALLIAANMCTAGVITVESDWTTYRVDLVTSESYQAFGGGPAGDIFHMYFDFNRAYLPYETEYVTDGFGFGTVGGGLFFVPGAEDPFDVINIDELAVRGSAVTFEINGHFIRMGAPWALHVADRQISSIGYRSVVGSNGYVFDIYGQNDGERSGSFHFVDRWFDPDSMTVDGYIEGIVDLGRVTQVPEPGSLALLATGLFGVLLRRKI